MPNQNQTTTARLKTATKTKVKRAMLRDKFSVFESALDIYIIAGIKAYREEQKQSQKN